MKNLILVLICCNLALLISCHNADPVPGKTANSMPTGSEKNSTTAIAEAFKSDSTGWGYKIFVNNEPFITQKFIPAIQGYKTFATKEDAQKVGDWVVDKMKKGEPFGVSDSLLKKLDIKY